MDHSSHHRPFTPAGHLAGTEYPVRNGRNHLSHGHLAVPPALFPPDKPAVVLFTYGSKSAGDKHRTPPYDPSSKGKRRQTPERHTIRTYQCQVRTRSDPDRLTRVTQGAYRRTCGTYPPMYLARAPCTHPERTGEESKYSTTLDHPRTELLYIYPPRITTYEKMKEFHTPQEKCRSV